MTGLHTVKPILWSALLATTAVACHAQAQTPSAPSLAFRVNDVLHAIESGHSFSAGELDTATTLPSPPTPAEVKEALPPLEKALESKDPDARTFALTLLAALESPAPAATAEAMPPIETSPGAASPADPQPPAAAEPTTTPQPAGSPTFKPELAQVLTPAIPRIASCLADDAQATRLLAANVLAGFAPEPPASIFAPLLAYLKRDDGVGPTGVAVVGDLLQFTPISPATAAALSTYLRRSDQTADTRANLVESIASHANQSQAVDATLLLYLSSDDNGLRARLILSLPQLDLAPDAFAETRARVTQLAALDAASGQENLQVVRAAQSVASCWTKTRMLGCPAY